MPPPLRLFLNDSSRSFSSSLRRQPYGKFARRPRAIGSIGGRPCHESRCRPPLGGGGGSTRRIRERRERTTLPLVQVNRLRTHIQIRQFAGESPNEHQHQEIAVRFVIDRRLVGRHRCSTVVASCCTGVCREYAIESAYSFAECTGSPFRWRSHDGSLSTIRLFPP